MVLGNLTSDNDSMNRAGFASIGNTSGIPQNTFDQICTDAAKCNKVGAGVVQQKTGRAF